MKKYSDPVFAVFHESHLQMYNKSILHAWVIGVICCTIIAALVYAMMPPEEGNFFQRSVSYFLWPGFALWVQLNGSLLFGVGFGKIGDFFVIALGSALAWSIQIFFVVRGIVWLRHRNKEPR